MFNLFLNQKIKQKEIIAIFSSWKTRHRQRTITTTTTNNNNSDNNNNNNNNN